jgi:hypothetical protein
MVGLMYILAACAAMFSIHIRCRGTIEDVERYSLKQGMVKWYAVRLTTVVIIIGGIMHLRFFWENLLLFLTNSRG